MADRSLLVFGVCALLTVAACKEEGVRAYRAPKPAGSHSQAPAGIAWDVPQGWESVNSDQPMRLATFKPASGQPEISITAFPGDSGGLLANINRWRGQLGLEPLDQSQLAAAVETSTEGSVKVTLTDVTGSKGQEMLGAVIDPGDGKTWFVKATGEPSVIASLKPDFNAFARSFRPAAATPDGGTPTAAVLPTPPPPTGDVHARLVAFQPPQHWKRDPAASAMVAAAYDAATPDGPARITATMLTSSGGGVLANINRWRDQLGLPPVQSLDQQPCTDLGHGDLIVDLTAQDGSRRMLAAIVTASPDTWFFKMTGPPKAIDAEHAAYEKLVRTVGLGERAP